MSAYNLCLVAAAVGSFGFVLGRAVSYWRAEGAWEEGFRQGWDEGREELEWRHGWDEGRDWERAREWAAGGR